MIYLINGTSNPFNAVSGIAIGTQDVGAYEPAFGDVNGDGFVDMAVANTNHVPEQTLSYERCSAHERQLFHASNRHRCRYGQDVKIADINGVESPTLF